MLKNAFLRSQIGKEFAGLNPCRVHGWISRKASIRAELCAINSNCSCPEGQQLCLSSGCKCTLVACAWGLVSLGVSLTLEMCKAAQETHASLSLTTGSPGLSTCGASLPRLRSAAVPLCNFPEPSGGTFPEHRTTLTRTLRFRNPLPDSSSSQQDDVPRPLRCPGCPGDKGSSAVDSLLSSHSYSWWWVTTVGTCLCFPFLFNSLFNVPYLPILTQLAHLTVPSGRSQEAVHAFKAP